MASVNINADTDYFMQRYEEAAEHLQFVVDTREVTTCLKGSTFLHVFANNSMY